MNKNDFIIPMQFHYGRNVNKKYIVKISWSYIITLLITMHINNIIFWLYKCKYRPIMCPLFKNLHTTTFKNYNIMQYYYCNYKDYKEYKIYCNSIRYYYLHRSCVLQLLVVGRDRFLDGDRTSGNLGTAIFIILNSENAYYTIINNIIFINRYFIRE